MNAEVHSLAGPYALQALPEDERVLFEAHLRACPSCRTEVEEFRATAARLGAATAETPPAALKSRIMAEVARTRQVSPASAAPSFAHRRRTPWRRRVLAAAVAAVLLAVGGVAGVAVVQLRDARQTASRDAEISTILAAPDSRTVHAPVEGGGRLTLVVSEREAAAVVVMDGLPGTPSNRTYQLWLIDGTQARSAGTVDLREPGRTTRILRTHVAGADGLGLTIEPAGGSRTPTPPVIATVPFR